MALVKRGPAELVLWCSDDGEQQTHCGSWACNSGESTGFALDVSQAVAERARTARACAGAALTFLFP